MHEQIILYYIYISTMNDVMKPLFGPLHKDYCAWFYYLSLFAFVLFLLSFGTMITLIIAKKRSGAFYLNSIMVLLWYVAFYFQNRLLHTMCSNSI